MNVPHVVFSGEDWTPLIISAKILKCNDIKTDMKQIKLLTKKKTKSQNKEKKLPPDSLSHSGCKYLHFPNLPLKGFYLDPIAFSCEYLPCKSKSDLPPP